MSDPDPGQSMIDAATPPGAAGVESHEIDVLLPEDHLTGELVRALGERLRMAAKAALEIGQARPGAVTIVLTDDDEVRGLNRQFRGADKPTNVLSFPLPETPQAPDVLPHLGDVVLARETIAREADDHGKTFMDHASHLTVHGVLHLLGHTHDAEEDAARMEALEVAALKRLGLPDPYTERPDAET